MKKYLYAIAVLFATIVFRANAQYPLDIKADYNWISGYGDYNPRPGGTSILNFSGLPDTLYRSAGINISFSSASISDTAGNLILFTNGYTVYDSLFNKINGADSLSCCNLAFELNYSTGVRDIDCVLAIKTPGYENSYTIIHKTIDLEASGTSNYSLTLLVSKIKHQNDTLIGINKNEIFFADTVYPVGIEACRHANGRDWWLIQKHDKINKFWVFLFDPSGIHLINTQLLPGKVPDYYTQTVFSPNGEKFIIAGAHSILNDSMFIAKFDFDRCTGLLSNPEYYKFKPSFGPPGSGAAISPDSKMLYISYPIEIFQFDISQPNWKQTKQIVATYDGFKDTIQNTPLGTVFTFMQLAPDNKIYIAGGNTRYLHTIENPNVSGTACNVSQHSIKLPSIHDRTISNFPNYRLGPIDGSPCDTLGIDNITNISTLLDNNQEPVKLYPNPATDYITLFVPRITKQWQFALYDIQGREVLHVHSRGAFRSINIAHLAQGMYLWKLVYEDGKQENGKVVKQ